MSTASATEVSPASVSRPAAPYDDVLDGWWDPANYRRGVYAIWLVADDGGIGT